VEHARVLVVLLDVDVGDAGDDHAPAGGDDVIAVE
jgi:hypothetical protein